MAAGYIDTHCHPYLDENGDAGLDRAVADGAEALVVVGIDGDTNRRVADIAARRPECFAALGMHPHSAHLAGPSFESAIREQAAASRKIVAIGEVGLDFFKSEAPRDVQLQVFDRAIDLAGSLNLPLVVHSRDAFDDTIARLSAGRQRHAKLKALFHCYSYGPSELERVLAEGFFVSYSGIVTFKSAKALQDSARLVPWDRYVIETDSPYLAPEPHRGKRNEPSWVRLVAGKIAELKGVSPESVLETTTRNARAFFNLPQGGSSGRSLEAGGGR